MPRELIDEWIFEATLPLRRVINAKRRLSASLTLNPITILAACDELDAATRDARTWAQANVCPDPELRARTDVMLKTCRDVARTARRAVSHPSGTTPENLDHLSTLLTLVDVHSEALERW